MSHNGAQNPGHARRRSLRAIEPISQHSSDDSRDAADLQGGEEEEGAEEFVDAQDSQADNQNNDNPERAKAPEKKARNFGKEAGAIIAPIAKYWKSQKKDSPPENANTRWQHRVESALIKMNAEMAALREQLEMQHEVMMNSSILGPFKVNRHRRGFFRWLVSFLLSATKTVLKHVLVDAVIVATVTVWMHYNGVPAERLEQLIIKWVGQLRQITFIRRLERTAARNIPQSVQRSLAVSGGIPRQAG